jgi:tetratricopeptide (TPR) repeat protein/predicted Ser/Thr protein kinase
MEPPPEFVGRILSHYRIVEQIGAGGMGVVYRAHDEQLDRDVALKVLPAGTLADDAARRQFRKEALALAKLSHPNIATVFEFSSQEGMDFLAMELIPGRPLSERLLGGAMPQPEIVRLTTQLAEGLAAAHDQGVIHRDLKPANLFVTPDGRLKILDFGLAKHTPTSSGADLTRSITSDTGTVSGTVPYMSPEQLRGLPVDPRSDIYAAGAVLHEMATGRRAFPQTQGAELMGAILYESPASARSVNKYVSPGLESIISKSLAKDPSQRYQSARELRVALEGLSTATSNFAGLLPVGPPKKSRIAIAVIAAAVALAGLGIGLKIFGVRDRRFEHKQFATTGVTIGVSEPPGSLAHGRRSVAVLGLKNVSGQADKAWLSTALAEMLTTELGAGEKLRTVAGENVAQMKTNLALPEADSYGRETLARIRENLNADAVVVGSFVPLGKDQIRLDLRLQDAVAGETLASVSAKGREDQIDDLVSRAGAELRQKLGAGAISATDAAAVKASLPSNAEAARLYSEGLAKLHARDTLAARDLLQKSLALEPSFALAHSALATAWTNLGYDGKATVEAKTAFDLSGGLGREDKLAIQARYLEANHDWEGAIGIYRTLTQFFPDNLEYGLQLALAENSAGKSKDALGTLQQLRQLPAPASQDPRLDLAESSAYFGLSKYKEAGEAGSRAAAKAQPSGQRLVLAQALNQEAAAFRYQDQIDKSNAAFQDAQRTYTEAGDRLGAAGATMGLATNLYQHGDLSGSRRLNEQALAVFREVGSQRNTATCLVDIAIGLYDQGNLAGAQKLYEEALSIQREIGDKDSQANTLNSIANVLADKGDQAGAKAKYEEALAAFRETGSQFEIAMTMSNIGELYLDAGDLPEAKRMLEDALKIKRSLHNRHSEAYTLSALGDLLLYEGDIAAARKAHEDALAIRTQLGEKGTAAQESMALARLTLEDGHPDTALDDARKAVADFHTQNQVDYEAAAHTLTARCLLQSGSLSEAKAEIQQAQKMVKTDDHVAHLPVAITSARIATASRDLATARKILDEAMSEATKANLLYFQYDARLALGELEIASGKVAAGRARLTTLEKDAEGKGFLLIVHKAATALKG